MPYLTVGDPGEQRFAQPLVAPELGNHDTLSIDVVNVTASSHTGSHKHVDRSEMIFFLNDGAMIIDNKRYEIEANSLIIVEAGETHTVINDSDGLLRILCIFAPALPKSEEAMEFIKQHSLVESS